MWEKQWLGPGVDRGFFTVYSGGVGPLDGEVAGETKRLW